MRRRCLPPGMRPVGDTGAWNATAEDGCSHLAARDRARNLLYRPYPSLGGVRRAVSLCVHPGTGRAGTHPGARGDADFGGNHRILPSAAPVPGRQCEPGRPVYGFRGLFRAAGAGQEGEGTGAAAHPGGCQAGPRHVRPGSVQLRGAASAPVLCGGRAGVSGVSAMRSSDPHLRPARFLPFDRFDDGAARLRDGEAVVLRPPPSSVFPAAGCAAADVFLDGRPDFERLPGGDPLQPALLPGVEVHRRGMAALPRDLLRHRDGTGFAYEGLS